jgi:superfamily II DNA helicase RecQ
MRHCLNCNLTFDSEDAHKYHKRNTHQDTVNITLQDGTHLSVNRNESGLFECPIHLKKGKTPRFVFSHKGCFNIEGSRAVQVQTTEQQDTVISLSKNDETYNTNSNFTTDTNAPFLPLSTMEDIMNFLTIHNIGYDALNKWLYCIACKGILSMNFNRHLKRVHKIHISTENWKKVIHNMQLNPFEINIYSTHQPLSYLETFEGYQCGVCFLCCINVKSIIQHCNLLHGIKSYQRCNIQSADIGGARSYFRVESMDSPNSMANRLNNDIFIDNIVESTIQSLQSSVIPLEDHTTRNILYSKLGWFLDPKEIQNYSTLKYYLYFECPDYLTPVKENIVNFINQSIDSIKGWDPLFKQRLGHEKKRKFSFLFSKNARRDYSSVFMKCIFFSIHFTRNPIGYYMQPSLDICDAAGSLINSFSVINLVRFLFQLVTERVSSSTKGMCILTLFMRLSCIRKDGSLMPAEYVSQLGSKLIYFMKMIYYLYCELDPNVGLGRFDDYIDMIQGDSLRFSTTIYIITSDAFNYASTLKKLPIIIETIPNKQINLKGIQVDFKNMGVCYQNMTKEIKRLINMLMLSDDYPKIDIDGIVDDLSQRSMGYSMKMRQPGAQKLLNQYIIKNILRNRFLHDEYVHSVKDNQIHWNASKVQQYVNMYDEFIRNICFMIHYVSGMPGRATELSTYKVSNGTSCQRNMFCSNKRIWFYVTYSKTNSLTDSSKSVIRFLDKETSNFMLLDFFIIRPFVQIISSYLKINPENTYSIDLFVVNGKKMDERDIRDNFAHLFQKYSTIPLTFQQFRHLSKYISIKIRIKTFQDYYKGFFQNEDDQDNDSDVDAHLDQDLDQDDQVQLGSRQKNIAKDPFSAQMGHSTRTGFLNYAGVVGAHNEVTDMEIQLYMRCSNQWQEFIKYNTYKSQGNPSNIAHEGTLQLPNPVQAEHETTKSNHQEIHPLNSNSIHTDDMNHSMELCHASVSYPSASQSYQSLKLLQKLYESATITFNTRYQHMAADNVLFTNNNMLVILPTGGGKSTLIWLNCLHNFTKSTIVIVPTVSLKVDLIEKAKKFKISVTDSMTDYSNQNLIIVTTDSATTQSFLFSTQRLAHRNQLSMIFIDEAHTFVTDSCYRDCMKYLTMFASTMCPITLMTATAPSWIENTLLKMFFAYQNPVVIRDSTNRSNIVYNCIDNIDSSTIKQVISDYHHILSQDERVICYFQTISDVDEWEKLLGGIPCAVYHSKIDAIQRKTNTDLWKSGQVKILLATSGFGLGVDYSHVKYVIIIDLPYSFEDYIQQCGRAGRNGQDAYTLLFYSRRKEMTRNATFIQRGGKIKSDMFLKMLQYAETSHCRRQIISSYMDANTTTCFYDPLNRKCDNCQSQSIPQQDQNKSTAYSYSIENCEQNLCRDDQSGTNSSNMFEYVSVIEEETSPVYELQLQTQISSQHIQPTSSKTVNCTSDSIIDEHKDFGFWETFFQQDIVNSPQETIQPGTKKSKDIFTIPLPTPQTIQKSDLQESPKGKTNPFFNIKGFFESDEHQELNPPNQAKSSSYIHPPSVILSTASETHITKSSPEKKRKALSFGTEQSILYVESSNSLKKANIIQTPTTASCSKGKKKLIHNITTINHIIVNLFNPCFIRHFKFEIH